jgi:hypothetical protein
MGYTLFRRNESLPMCSVRTWKGALPARLPNVLCTTLFGIGDCRTDTKVMAIRNDERASHLRRPAIASPRVCGTDQEPRDIRTLWRWRESRRGPSFLKIGGRYFYTIGALRLPALMDSDWNCRRQTLGLIPTTLRNTRVKWAWSHIPQARATCERGSRVFSMMTWA